MNTDLPQAHGMSIFGVNSVDEDKDPIVVICLITDTGEIIRDTILAAPLDYARDLALRIMDEADAAEHGLRPISDAFSEDGAS